MASFSLELRIGQIFRPKSVPWKGSTSTLRTENSSFFLDQRVWKNDSPKDHRRVGGAYRRHSIHPWSEVTHLPANKRSTSTVFQEWALFPHKNVHDNIAFGMRMKKMPKAEIDQKIQELLTLIRLEGYEKRMPFE